MICWDALLFSDQDLRIEEWAHFYYRKLIKNSFNTTKAPGNNIDNKHVGGLFPDNAGRMPQMYNIQQVKLDNFDSIGSHEVGGEWLCALAIKELGLDHYLGEQPDTLRPDQHTF